MEFFNRYGPWALISGASEGTGREFARQVAAKGVNCVLLARREGPLRDLAKEIEAEFGVECVSATVDLARPDAIEKILETVGDREIGLYISNAGADPNGSYFLNKPVDAWVDLITRNVLNSIRCCHHFGGMMRERGRGGILLVGSGACYGGGPHLATYSGVKAFDLAFAEGLWSELQPRGVDVLCLVMTTTDTPALHNLLTKKGLPTPPNIASAADVAALGLARLPYGPIQNWGLEDDETGYAGASAAARRARVGMMAEASKITFGEPGS
jgi:short-subunit dehydrogenase